MTTETSATNRTAEAFTGSAPVIVQLRTPPPIGASCDSGATITPGVVVRSCTHLPPSSGPTGMW